MEITYCFIGTDKLSLKEFNEKIVSQATEIISKKSNKIIMSDKDILLARFLHKRKYRKVTIYHVGNEPKHKIGNFALKGGFTTESDVECNLRNDADKIISSRESKED